MILKSIKLENIRSYNSEVIEFPEGSVLLSGDIGSGKSTVLLAAEFALFGIMRPSLSGNSLLRKGKDRGAVELRFALDGKEIIVRRGLKRTKDTVGQDTGFVIVDGVKTEGTAVELKSKILDMLGYPKDLVSRSKSLIYRYTVYTPQEEMKRILFEDAEQRLDTLRKVFGIDKYKRINENAAIYVKKLKDDAKHLSAKTDDLELKKKQAEEKRIEKQVLQEKKKEIRPELEAATAQKQAKRSELEAIEQDIKKLNNLKNKLDVADTRLTEKVQQASAQKKEVEELTASTGSLSEKIDVLDGQTAEKIERSEQEIECSINEKEKGLQQLLSASIQLKEKVSQLNALEKQILEKKKYAERLSEKEGRFKRLQEEVKGKEQMELEIKNNETLLIELNSTIKNLEHSISDLEERKTRISDIDECPLCQQSVCEEHKTKILNDADARMNAHQVDLSRKKEQHKEAEARFGELRIRLRDVLERKAALHGLKAELESLYNIGKEVDVMQQRFAEIEQQKIELSKSESDPEQARQVIKQEKELLKKVQAQSNLFKEKQALTVQLQEKQNKKETLEKNILKIKQEIGAINSEKMALNEEIASMQDIESRLQAKKEELQVCEKKQKALEIRDAEFDKEIQGHQNMLDMLLKEIDEKERFRKELLRKRGLHEMLEKGFINLMNVIEKHVMLKVHKEFNDTFTKWFNVIIDDETLSVKLDDTFSPIVVQNGYETELENLSGGEKTAVALSYRLSLNKVINDVVGDIKTKDLIILDEPTDGFSTEQLDKVRDVLDELDIKQVMLVSHESKIESFVDNTIRVVKNEHVSRVV